MFFRKKGKSFNLPEVLEGCMKGRQSAQRQLYEQYYTFAKSICLRYAASQEQAEEMVNDGFLKVLANLASYNPALAFEAWFRTVVVRTSIDYYRRNKPQWLQVNLEEAPEVEYNDEMLENLSAEDILKLVQLLPPAYRTVFSLYVVEGFSHAEIAEALGINEGTSRSNLAKARMKLQEWVKVYQPELKKEHNV